MEKFKLIDISKQMLSCTPAPEDTPAVVKTIAAGETGGKRSILLTSLHNGTHLCAPSAYLDGAKSIDQYAPERFIGTCRVVKAKGALTGAWIEKMSLYRCEKLLIKGEGKGKLDSSAAQELVASGVKLVGTDADTIGIAQMNDEVMRIFAEADCLVLAGLDLQRVSMGTYFLMAQPILLEGCEAAPCRALLAEDYIYWTVE